MNEQLLKDFIATAQKYNYNWNKAFGLFPELEGYDQQVLKDYVATAEKFNYDYLKVNSLFPELGFKQEPLKKKESTDLASKSGKSTSGSYSRRFEGVTEEPISQKKVRTDDYIDQVQNAKTQPKQTKTKVTNTFVPNAKEETVDVLTTDEANEMMAQDFGKKEFELYSQISEIDPSVFSQGEAASVEYLNNKFKGSGFVFEETGVGNSVKVKSTLNDGFGTVVNEKVIDLPSKQLTAFGLVQNKTQNETKDEMAQFMNQAFLKKSEKEFLNEDVKDYGQLVKLAVTNPQKYGESFLNQYDTERWIDKQYLDLVVEGKSIKREQQTLEQEIKAYQDSGVFNEETERMLRGRAANLQNQVAANTQKYEEMKDITSRLPQAAAVYFKNKEKEGSLAGLVSGSLLGGLLNMEKMLITTAADVAPLVLSSTAIIPEVQQVKLKASGMSDAQIKDYASKQLRKGIVEEALKGVDDFVSFGTTDEYIQSKDRNDLEKVVNFLGESVGTAISAGGSPALQSLAFFSQSYNAMEEEMNSPEFDGLTQMEKKLMSVPYGLVIGQLDKLGFNIATNVAKNPLLNKLVTNTIARAFTSLPKNASVDVMEKAIEESVKATMAKSGLEIVGGALVEGTTEGVQSLAEYTMKNLYNNVIADKDVFQNVPDITTKEGFKKAVTAAGEELYYGALGGLIMGAGGTAIRSISNGFDKGEKEFDFFEKVINDPNLRSLIQTDIKTKVTSGELTKAEAYEQIDAINKSVSILNSMPSDLPVESKKEAYNLILERNKIEKQIEGKDPNLVAAQTERVKEINEQLKGLSYAVQEQSTGEVSVQSGAGVSTEVAQGVPGTEAQKPAGETVTEEVKAEVAKEEVVQSEENQRLIDAYVKRETQLINVVTVLNQEEKQQRIQELEADPVAYAEKYAAVLDSEENSINTDFLNSLQRQPVAETATTQEQTEVTQPAEDDNSFVYKMNTERTSRGKGMWEDDFEIIDNRNGVELGEEASKWAVVNKITGESVEAKSKKDAQNIIKNAPSYGDLFGEGTTVDFTELNEQAQNKYREQFEQQKNKVQPAVQETVQAEPTAKIETIEVQEVPQVEQSLDDLTQQNNVLTQNDFTAARVRNVGKEKVVAQIAKAAKAIVKVLPNVKIIVHTTPEAFVEATKDMEGRLSEGGLYDQQTGEIHINLEKASNRTVAHEVFHALILSRVSSDIEAQRLTRSMIGSVRKSLKKAEGTTDLISYLEDFESNYDENIKNEEKLAELFGVLADNYKALPPASKNIIIRFLNRLAKALGLKEMTDREAIAFMNTLSRKVETGEEIQASEVGRQKEGNAAVRKQIIGEIGAKKLDQEEKSNLRMNNLEVAKDMRVAGETPKKIRNATGWEMGAEGKWRYETVDNVPFFKDTVRIVQQLLAENKGKIVSQKANYFLPQELLNMYPELNDYSISFTRGNENEGDIDTDKKTIKVGVGVYPKNTVSTLLHEIQHAIQEIEGFDSGASAQKIMDDFLAKDNALKNRINRLKKNSPDSPLLNAVRNERKAFIDNFSTVNKNNEKVLDKFNLYMRKAGEIEARNVETRMNMTAEQRRNTLLTETEDVKDRQIIETAPRKFAVRKQKLAPNGKPSNLNDQQWEQVRTPEFKAWFGDWENNPENASKVVDENGEPLVVSHFTDQKFDVFKYKEGGFHFGEASLKDDLEIAKGKKLPIELKVFLNIKSPLRIEDSPRFFAEDILKQLERESEYLLNDETIDKLYDKFENIEDGNLQDPETKKSNELIKEVEKLGIDGYIYENKFDSQDSKSSYIIDEKNSKIYMRNDGVVVVGNVKKLEGSNARPFITFASKSGSEYYSEKNEAEEINDSDKNRIKELLDDGNIIYTINSPKTYSDFELFTGPQQINDSYIAFQPNQIKSATDNVGTFSEREFSIRKQKTTGADKIVNEGTKAGKTDAQIRQEGKAAGFTNKEMTEALSKYYTKEQGVFMKSGVKGLVGENIDRAKRFKQQYLTSKGLLPKIGFFFKEKMEGFISSESNRAAKTAKKFGVLFDKFTGDKKILRDAFDKALRGDKSIKLPAGFAALANEMRNHIDRLSQMLIDSGAVDADMADTIRNNMGTYITRSYEIFDNKNFRQKVGEQELQAAKNFLRTQPGMLGLAQAEAARTGVTVDEALDALVDNKIDEYFADAETGALVKGSKLGSKDLSTLKERKEIPEQIRMLMGEYSDPAMNYARTVLNIASLAARHQFLTQVKEAGMGKFFFEKNDSQRPKGFDTEIAAEGSDTMSPLNGLMTTPEIAEAFGIYEGQKGKDSFIKQAFKVYYKAMALVKHLKTIESVSTHMKNVFSNFGFVGLNGHSLVEIGNAIKVVAQDLKTMSKPEIEAKIDEYIKAGVMRQGAGINEIKDMFKDADMDDFLERRLSMRKPKGVMGKIKQAISSRGSKLIRFAEDLYQAEDDIFKIAAYETEMNRYADALYDKSKDQLTDKERKEVSDIAVNNVKNTYPTSSRIPEGIKQLRKFPLFIGSFISFQAESYRTAYNTIQLAKDELSSDNEKIRKIGARRVAGASAYLTAKTAILSYLGYAAGTGIGGLLGALFDDDDEKKKEKDVRNFLPPWSKNSDLIILKAADGEIEYIDFSASDPHGGINKALNALLKGEDMVDSFKQSMLELVGQFQGPDILTNLAFQLNNNENDFGKPIYNEEDSRANKIEKVLEYVSKVVEPGTATSIRKAVRSEQSLGQIAFGEATGLKIRKVNVKDQFVYKLPEFDESFKDIRNIYNSEYYKSVKLSEDPKATSKDIQDQNKKTADALIEANQKYAAKAKELMDLINSANKFGVDYDELIDQLKTIKSTMGKSNIYEMEDGGTEFIKEKYY